MIKQQHYVPRCYLRNFANSKGQIWVYEKNTDKVFLSNIEGIASEKFFYDAKALDDSTGVKQFVEKALSLLEGQAATVFGELLTRLEANSFNRLHPNERYFLAQFIAVQMLRTREQRLQIEQMSNQISAWMRSYLAEGMKAASPEQVPPLKISEHQLAELQGRFLSDPDVLTKYAEILDSHFWIILRALPGHAFMISDHPVGKRGNVHRLSRPLSGIASKGIELVFPLSPNYCLCLYERSHFQSKLQRFKSSEDRVHELGDKANMDYCNYFQIEQSTRFLFDTSDEFSFAKAVCAEQPLLRNQSRCRVGTA